MPKRLISNRLATRLAVLLTLALAPLGLIAVYSEYAGWQARRAADEVNLILRTIDSVTGQRALLESAMQSARSLSPMIIDRLDDPEACSELLREFISNARLYAFAGFIEPSGLMRCASHGEEIDFSQEDDFARAMAQPLPFFTFSPIGRVSQQPVIIANWPVYVDQQNMGRLSISISHRMLEVLSTNPNPDTAPMNTFLVNHRGETLTRSLTTEIEANFYSPAEIRELVARRNGVFRLTDGDGEESVIAVAQLIPGQLYVVGRWDVDQDQRGFSLHYARFGFPVLMWIASVGVVMLSVHLLVVRHLRHINTQMRRFALGAREDFTRLPDEAPTELREIDSTFSKMARLISRDEQELESALREKTVLLREVHHRVKNNLQLIASILNLQIRRLHHPDALEILRGVQARVRALASIHRMLYEETRVSDIDATAFLSRIMTDTVSLATSSSQALEIEQHFDPVSLPAEKIIPAALLFSEALTNALKYASAPPGRAVPKLVCGIRSHDGIAELWVRNTLSDVEAEEGAAKGLGRELMAAFAVQIGAELEIGTFDDEHGPGWQMCLRVPDSGMKHASKARGRAL